MSDARQTHRSDTPMNVLTAYLWVVMPGLLLQGIGCLTLFRLAPALAGNAAIAAIFSSNPPHAWIHVGWGAAGTLVLITERERSPRWWLAVVFAVFYTALGILGMVVDNPFGLRLGLIENSFHLTVGPVMLILAIWARERSPGPAVGRQ